MTRHTSPAQPLNPDVLDCFTEVMGPEIGLNVVDLGVVHQVERDSNSVTATLKMRAPPLGGMIAGDTQEHLAHRFQDLSRISVRIVWNSPWNPDRITQRGPGLLGRSTKAAS